MKLFAKIFNDYLQKNSIIDVNLGSKYARWLSKLLFLFQATCFCMNDVYTFKVLVNGYVQNILSTKKNTSTNRHCTPLQKQLPVDVKFRSSRRGIFCKKLFLKISQNSQENSRAGVSFLINCRAEEYSSEDLSLKNTSSGCFCKL